MTNISSNSKASAKSNFKTSFESRADRAELIIGLVAATLVAVAILLRLVPHSANFSFALAAVFFAGSVFRTFTARLLFPLIVLLATDFVLGIYDGIEFVYASYIITVAIGVLNSDKNPISTLVSGLTACFLFFGISNFGVWYATNLYPKNWGGLIDCYVMAIPFFKNTLIGTTVGLIVLNVCFWAIRRVVIRALSLKAGHTHNVSL